MPFFLGGGVGPDSVVGKGNHSTDHIQKIKPRVEQVCREMGLQYSTENNAGRIYINLQGGPAQMPPQFSHENGGGGYGPTYGGNYGQQQQHQQGQQHHGGQAGGYPGQQQQQHHHGGNHQQQQQQQNAEIEAAVKRYLPRIIRKLEGCCVVM